MQKDDMVVISTDDHICEPPTLFDNQLSGELLASAPKLKVDSDGKNFWEYQGYIRPSVGLNAVVGRPFEEYGMEPTSLDQLRDGCYDVHARIDDMDVNGIAASMCFGNSIGFDGQTFHKAPDKKLSLRHMQAYNDWHYDEWCMAYPGRFIPIGILPTWDQQATVDEVNRLARKGFNVVSMNENPTVQGLPSIHNDYWDPIFKAITDNDMTIACHIGSGNPAPHASMESPIEAWISTMPMSVAQGVSDWLQLEELHKYPNMRIIVAEGSIGWVPYLMERADFSNWRHKAWTRSRFQDVKPSELMKRHFCHCFLWDPYGLKNLDEVGVENVTYEVDYPHSDALWPDAAELLWEQVKDLSDEYIDMITHKNAIKWLKHDSLFENFKREEINVGALHAQAAAKGVDTAPKSSGGSVPSTETRPVTSGDVMEMFKAHAEKRAKEQEMA
ncbi:amidohydrolase family protein [Novosphingobium malaysiense]|uniref:Amidohydrolase n=1 Tax=Novosphingobium malaysiense TaxID=1348853 RepID=A0A0B1ZSW9_9SPHN|nr:amidohydrolase family protein [Novosphingobium malaysiense]KHK92233.1 amidohydrolase [Novosphingobium malaysiense]